MKVAALDLGSNTFLCLIAEVTEQGIQKIYSDSVEIVRLGQELEKTGHFHPDALKRADNCLRHFYEIIQKEKPEKVLAMATSAARDAANKDELFRIAQNYKIPLEIIPGDQEARITYLGAVAGRSAEKRNMLVIDIGGGSTEFIFGSGRSLIDGESYDIGCVRLTERFIKSQPTPDEEIRELTACLDEKIKAAKNLMASDFVIDEIIAVAGTPTTLAAADIGKFDAERIEGYILDKPKLEGWLSRLKAATVDQKIKMGIPAGRADVILVGVLILLRSLDLFKMNEITVSTKGVRFGIALELAHRSYND